MSTKRRMQPFSICKHTSAQRYRFEYSYHHQNLDAMLANLSKNPFSALSW
ncbi:MAG: hypothetical protein F6K36_27575 [Symploca sp. SIO3C6]|nr:hypothetical protein [Symploca sp. SIO3C6]